MSVFQFQSFNFPDRFIRHKNFEGLLTQQAVGEEGDFVFELVNRGHDEHGAQLVSLRSVNFPDRRLRHRDFHIFLEGPTTADQVFQADSTFFLEPGLADPSNQNAVSFRSTNFPDRYLRHRDFQLWVEPKDTGNLLPDATFLKTVSID